MSNAATVKHEPLVRVVKRDMASFPTRLGIRFAGIVLALILSALFIVCVTGLNPIDIYSTMLDGSFGSTRRFCATLRDWTSLLLIAIALAPAFRMKFWNIGAEGQVLIGALGTAIVMYYLGDVLPAGILFPAMLLASVLLGGLWGFIPALFKAKFGTNETLFTLMLNYVATKLVSCFYNLWRGTASALGMINKGTEAGWFPQFSLFGINARYALTVYFTILMIFLIYFYLRYTKHGYEIAVVGESQATARYAGIKVDWVIIRTMILSGALCGLVGFFLVCGRDQTISTATAGGNGFTAIIVTWLSHFNTFAMAAISYLLIFLDKGATQISSKYTIMNAYSSEIIKGIILFCLLGCEFFLNYRLVFRGHKKEVR